MYLTGDEIPNPGGFAIAVVKKAGDWHGHGRLVYAGRRRATCSAQRRVIGMGYGFGKLTKYYAKKAQRKREHDTLCALLDETVGKEICA